MDYESKLNKLHKEIIKKEGVASDYVIFSAIKNFFNVPNLSFYDFGIVKQVIQKALKDKGYN
ncbi:MAG: hypothetical protein KJ939_00835 [Nanoarchaeota archaeon]|nr:hypothetical protein [Nanoarchaeota archaeon]